MARAMSGVDRSGCARPACDLWGYWIPEPALIVGPAQAERTQRYILNWLRAEPIWLYVLRVPDATPLKVAPQAWRTFLNGVPDDGSSLTRCGRRGFEIKAIFGSVFSQEDFDPTTQEPVQWHDLVLTHVSDAQAPWVLWEMFELGFRHELLALDRYLRPTAGRRGEARREEQLSQVFPGQTLHAVTSLPTSSSPGLFSPVVHRRINALNAFREVLSEWPGCPSDVADISRPLRGSDSEEMIEEMEFQVARFYVATFFSHSGRAPLVPHLSPAPIS